jgi:co-chaperonin GroES (HSP10)
MSIEVDKVFEPLLWRIVVKPPKMKEKTAGGIYIPDSSQDSKRALMNKGEVVSIGPLAFKSRQFVELINTEDGVKERVHKPEIGEGDWVVFDRRAAQRFEVKDKDDETVLYFVINDTSVLTKIPDPKVVRTYVFDGDESEIV